MDLLGLVLKVEPLSASHACDMPVITLDAYKLHVAACWGPLALKLASRLAWAPVAQSQAGVVKGTHKGLLTIPACKCAEPVSEHNRSSCHHVAAC